MHYVVDRVERVGPIDGDRRDALRHFDLEEFIIAVVGRHDKDLPMLLPERYSRWRIMPSNQRMKTPPRLRFSSPKVRSGNGPFGQRLTMPKDCLESRNGANHNNSFVFARLS